jgi:hypothetical protein
MMKCLFVTAFALLTFSAGTYAQGLSFGIKAGTDVHKLEGITFSDHFTFGYHAGAFATIRLNSQWGIQPEIYFSQINVDTGSRFSQVYEFKKIPTIKFGYINIPVLLNFSPGKVLTLQAGPQYGIMINNNVSLLQNGQDALKDGDFAVVGGLQLKFSKVRVYGRYVVGLSDLNDIDNKDRWKSQTIHAGLAFAF